MVWETHKVRKGVNHTRLISVYLLPLLLTNIKNAPGHALPAAYPTRHPTRGRTMGLNHPMGVRSIQFKAKLPADRPNARLSMPNVTSQRRMAMSIDIRSAFARFISWVYPHGLGVPAGFVMIGQRK